MSDARHDILSRIREASLQGRERDATARLGRRRRNLQPECALSSDAELIDGSASKVLLTAVAGINLKMLGPFRFFAETTLDRGVAEGTENKYAAKAGISLTFKD